MAGYWPAPTPGACISPAATHPSKRSVLTDSLFAVRQAEFVKLEVMGTGAGDELAIRVYFAPTRHYFAMARNGTVQTINRAG